MKMLADMGAQVLRLESCQRLESYRTDSLYQNDVEGEFWNRGANFYEQNRNKLGITLDLTHPTGLSLLRELVGISDVFAENFTPRVIKNFHLEYEDLRQLKPDIIMVSSTGYGFTGPWANFGATGPATEGASGLACITGYREGPPLHRLYRRRAHCVRCDGSAGPPAADPKGSVHRHFPDRDGHCHRSRGAIGLCS